MAVLLLQETRATREQYDRVDEILRPAGDDILEGLIQHSAGLDGDTRVVVDVWDSVEAFGRFAEEQIGPAGEQVGLGPIEPRALPLHHHIRAGERQASGGPAVER